MQVKILQYCFIIEIAIFSANLMLGRFLRQSSEGEGRGGTVLRLSKGSRSHTPRKKVSSGGGYNVKR